MVSWLPQYAGAQSPAPRAGSLGDFFLEYLLWLLPALALIGWFRAWILALIPICYVVYVQALIWPKFTPTGYSDGLLLAMFAGYALVCLLVIAVAAAIGNERRLELAPEAPDEATGFFNGALPYAGWMPIAAGVLAGIALRLLYSGRAGAAYAAMMVAFLYLSPLLVGAVTVYVAETRRRRTWAYYAWAPALANLLYVAGALIFTVEGLICAVIVLPLFAALGAVGGLVMGAICRTTQWPRPAILSLAALPLVLGAFESAVPLPERVDQVERSVLIQASPQRIWREIHKARHIRPTKWTAPGCTARRPASASRRDRSHLGRARAQDRHGKGHPLRSGRVDWDENRYVRWTYRFAEDSFPPYALDEHVVIGGHYFDLRDTSYTLTPRGDATELRIRMSYRVSTQFNWYAVPVANLLFGNFEDVILDFYRRRSEGVLR